MTILVNRDDYFETAMRVLAEEGPGALKVGRLCRTLGVTTGSFYHHFTSMRAFVDELLAHWEREDTAAYVPLLEAVEDAGRAVRLLREIVVQVPHRAEAALRAWSHADPQVAAAQARVDAQRLEAVQRLLTRVIGDPTRASRLALLGMVLLAGFQMGRDPDDRSELAVLLDEYLALLVGPSELPAECRPGSA